MRTKSLSFFALALAVPFLGWDARPISAQEKPAANSKKAKAERPIDRALLRALASIDIERDVPYGRAGERILTLDILRPKKPSGDKLPVVFFVHGGGWSKGNKTHGYPVVAPYVASGNYIACSVGYRLTGEAKWPAQIHDCKAALRWMRANAAKHGGDPERIGLVGPSAGGHLVALLGTTANNAELEGDCGSPGVATHVNCVVDIFGPTDLVRLGRAIEALGRGGSIQALFGGTVAEKLEVIRKASPINMVHAKSPPFLILHGSVDRTVPIAESTRLRDQLRKVGVAVAMVTVKGAGHEPLGDEANKIMYQFMEKHLRGQPGEFNDCEIEKRQALSIRSGGVISGEAAATR